MVTTMPSLDGVRAALLAFHAAVDEADDELTPAVAAKLHADLAGLAGVVERERDNLLALARRVGATWERLETTSGVADSTLRDRLTRWEVAR